MAEENTTVARPYAEGVYALAQETKQLAVWLDGLEMLAQIVEPEAMQGVLLNPAVETAKKLQLITDIAGDNLTKPLSAFLNTLAENGRLLLLPTIARLFVKLKQAESGDMEVEVSSAYVLKAAEKEQLEAALSKKFERNVNIVSSKDSLLIGGVKIKADDFVIDGSIKGQLTQLANQLGI